MTATLFDYLDETARVLYPEPVARATDPATSHEAARAAAPRAGTTRARALIALAHAGTRGLTDFELADRTGVGQTSIGKRRKDLADVGLVEATEERRPSHSGCPALVWRITPAGVEEARRVVHEERAL